MAARIQALEAEVATLRSIQANSNKRQFGAKSEQQNKAPSDRKRGQQPGGHGHGRTPRPALEANTEIHEPAPEALRCWCCHQTYAPNGMHESELIEIEVQAHKRVLRRLELELRRFGGQVRAVATRTEVSDSRWK